MVGDMESNSCKYLQVEVLGILSPFCYIHLRPVSHTSQYKQLVIVFYVCIIGKFFLTLQSTYFYIFSTLTLLLFTYSLTVFLYSMFYLPPLSIATGRISLLATPFKEWSS